jgi:hypothetical protein
MPCPQNASASSTSTQSRPKKKTHHPYHTTFLDEQDEEIEDDDDEQDEDEDDEDEDDEDEDDEDEDDEEIDPGLYVKSTPEEILDWSATIVSDIDITTGDDDDAINALLADGSNLGVTLSAEEESLSIDDLVERLAAERTKQIAQFRMKLVLWGKCAIARKKGFA